VSLEQVKALKGGKKIIMLTAYDYQMARILGSLHVDMLLVGDSLGVVVQGNASTKKVSMDAMLYHTEIVIRGSRGVPVIADMPIHSYETPRAALSNALRFMEIGSSGVKFEGAFPDTAKELVSAGVPVMAHLGLLPQTAAQYHVVGKDQADAAAMIAQAQELEKAGAFSIVLECVPESLAKAITETIGIPTIGIGAGKYCDGQVLVINDLLGLDRGETHPPKFRKQYAEIGNTIATAVASFIEEVQDGKYPDAAHTYH